jgi:hypothetical protein
MINFYKLIAFCFLMVLLMGCANRSKETQQINFTEKQQAINKQDLNGIWAISEDENASFRIKGDSMYFLEDTFPCFIELRFDTLITYYDGLITKDKIIKLDQDSLVLFNEVNEYIRLKKR